MTRRPIVLNEEQRRAWMSSRTDMVEGIDFICYEQVPLGPFDLICTDGARWIDRRTTDGEILAVDGRNAKPA